jgi:methylmalonyl-CoA mutase cobalamin-binding domain/chain
LDLAEDRGRFSNLLKENNIPYPKFGVITDAEEAITLYKELGFPLLVRPSYVLGGQSMKIVIHEEELEQHVVKLLHDLPGNQVLLDHFLQNAIEAESDSICDGKDVHIIGMMEHIEPAGIHSGDSYAVLPTFDLSENVIKQMEQHTKTIAVALNTVGLLNIQFAIKDEIVYIIEANPRASRTVPFIAKAYDEPYVNYATKVMLGAKVKDFTFAPKKKGYAIKIPVFSYEKFPEIQKELGITSFIDPFAGSYYVEKLTAELVDEAWKLIQEVEELGGMAKAIETGVPKMRIEEAAAKKQARIDSGKDIIVGVNRFQVDEKADIEILEIDNSKVRSEQINRLKEIKLNRNQKIVDKLLSKLEESARSEKENLLEIAVECAIARCTLGEISFALEKVYGRYKATIRAISQVYSKEAMKDEDFLKAIELVETFSQLEGRRPRIMIAKMGQDGHDRGAKVIATAFADIGFDVDIGPLFQTPEEAAKQAIENDVHILGVSSLAAGHKTLVPAVIEELKKQNRSDIMLVAVGVIPQKDYSFLEDAGVFGIYGPGTKISKAAQEILNLLIASHQ